MAEKEAKKPNFLVRAGRGIARFFRDTKGEMKKVVWPSRKQVLNNLAIVIVFVVVLAILVFLLDLLFVSIINGTLGLAGSSSSVATSDVASSVASEVTSTVSSVVSSVSSVISAA